MSLRKPYGAGMVERHGERREFPVNEPAPTITEKVGRSATWSMRTGNFTALSRDADGRTSAAGSIPYERAASEPAPTVRGATAGEWVPTHYDRRQQSNGDQVPLISVDRPAPTIAAQGLAKGRDVWVSSRTATTVNGDPRISEPGHHDSDTSGSQQANAVRVSLAEALVLQSFAPDFPVQGSRTAQFLQVGNAIPPLLAWHVLRAVLSA